MGKKKIVLVLSLFLCFYLFFMMLSYSLVIGQSTSDIDYTFYENEFSNTTDTFHNLAHKNELTEDFNGSYSFNIDDIGDEGEDIIFISTDDSDADCYFKLEAHKYKHNTVLWLDDNSGGGNVDGYNSFSAQGYGTIEFYVSKGATSDYIVVGVGQGTTYAIQLRIYNNDLDIHYGGSFHNVKTNLGNSIYFRIRIDLECTLGGYLGLGQYEMNVYVDGIKEVDAEAFSNNIANFNRFWMGTSTAGSGSNIYFDAFGYSWLSNYTINGNIEPDITTIPNTSYSSDIYEFNIDNNSLPLAYSGYNMGKDYSNPKDWEIVDPGTNDVYIQNGYYYDYYNYPEVDFYDNGIVMDTWDFDPSEGGIKNDSLDIQGFNYEVSYEVRFMAIGGAGSDCALTLYIYALNGSEVIRWRLLEHDSTAGRFKVQYYTGSIWSTWSAIDNCDNLHNLFTLRTNVVVSDNVFKFSISAYCNDTLVMTSFYLPCLLDATGISEIRLYGCSPNGWVFKPRIENIGLYNHGVSVCREKGYLQLKGYQTITYGGSVYDCFYKSEIFNLITVDNSNYSLIYLYGDDSVLDYVPYYLSENTYDDFFNNTYGRGIMCKDGSLFVICNTYISNSCIPQVEGVMMSDGTNEYIASYSVNNVDLNKSYFYVSSSRLYHRLEVNQSNKWEIMNCSFNIVNIGSTNRSVQFYSHYNGLGSSQINIEFPSGNLNYINYSHYGAIRNEIISPKKVIDQISFRISDNNDNELNENNLTGYILDVSLLYYPGQMFGYTTGALVSVIPALLIIIVPSFSISTIIEPKERHRKYFLPLVAIMSIICYATSVIPAWVLFVILIGIAGTMLSRGEG